MLKLVNVSKYYYSKGVVTSGFSRVNLEMHRGEFIAITGESGSGKSTLLNVISGLDSYEEGEMYIFGQETSGYTETDFENYRKRYIANIFQNFNLVNSYTVYQNVELALVMNGRKRREYRRKIMEVLKQVGLYKFRNARASRLSGGQKQRVAIARALVKDTPVIVADEPTGNLDSQSAENVWELLSSVAKDRLVVVVTHNFEQAEPYITRKITMHDGQVIEDVELRKPEEMPDEEESGVVHTGKLRLFQKFRLGIRNTFNIVPKFLLLLFIFMFITAAVSIFYSSTLKNNFVEDTSGYNWYFDDTDVARIVIQKKDRSVITEDDFRAISAVEGIGRIVKEDILIDRTVYIWSEDLGVNGTIVSVSEFKGRPDIGRLPEQTDEILVALPKNHYLTDNGQYERLLQGAFSLELPFGKASSTQRTVTVSGVVLSDLDDWKGQIYVNDELMTQVSSAIGESFSTSEIEANGHRMQTSDWDMNNAIMPVDWIEPGKALVSEEWNGYYKNYRAKGKTFTVSVKNLYYTDELELTISDVYTYRNFKNKTGGLDDWYRGAVFVNTEDYLSLFDKGYYQSSVYLSDYSYKDSVMTALEGMGYKTLHVNSNTTSYGGNWAKLERLITTGMGAALMVTLFLVSYFIIRLIMRSRNTYFSTVRILGGTASECRSLIVIELLAVLNLAYAALLGVLYAAEKGYFSSYVTDTILTYLTFRDYVILYCVMLAVCLWIALRYSRQLFKGSAMNTLKAV
ncbi:MAG: ABC transporter ATP-binding protein [Oscillospiraceae bacterium]|nr:ABC transporter ATP-binding protein [Oscillospiraceae bacterium]